MEAFGFIRPTWGHQCQTKRHTEWIVHPTVDKTGTCKLKFFHIRSIFELLVTLSFTNHLYMCACGRQEYTINLKNFEILRIFSIVWNKGRTSDFTYQLQFTYYEKHCVIVCVHSCLSWLWWSLWQITLDNVTRVLYLKLITCNRKPQLISLRYSKQQNITSWRQKVDCWVHPQIAKYWCFGLAAPVGRHPKAPVSDELHKGSTIRCLSPGSYVLLI